jgi:DNA-binding transcriptional ArsR family regulator
MTKQPPALTQLVEVYKALGHPVRLRILAMLRTGELCACQITAVLKLAPSTVSAHLGELRRAGVVVERKEGRWVIFRHADDAQAQTLIANAVANLAGDARIEADARIVKHLRRIPLEKLCRAELDLGRVGIHETAAASRAWGSRGGAGDSQSEGTRVRKHDGE